MSEIIRWYSIPEASKMTGLDDEFIRQAIAQKLLITAKTGRLGSKEIISNVELNRFSMQLQYGKKFKNAKLQARENTNIQNENAFHKQLDDLLATV